MFESLSTQRVTGLGSSAAPLHGTAYQVNPSPGLPPASKIPAEEKSHCKPDCAMGAGSMLEPPLLHLTLPQQERHQGLWCLSAHLDASGSGIAAREDSTDPVAPSKGSQSCFCGTYKHPKLPPKSPPWVPVPSLRNMVMNWEGCRFQ